jgi:hypothetical protein
MACPECERCGVFTATKQKSLSLLLKLLLFFPQGRPPPEYKISVSFVEVYQDKYYDLFDK